MEFTEAGRIMVLRFMHSGLTGPSLQRSRRHRASRSEGSRGRLHASYDPRGPPFETPHKGYHYADQRGRYFEGWYWRVTLPGDAESFALIYSIEDPRGGEFSGVGAQVRMAPLALVDPTRGFEKLFSSLLLYFVSAR